jgi:PTH1 family peptidyl-tRNA hydrolase
MKLIVGLGNPGPKYKGTRHNAGFMVVDKLADKYNIRLQKEEKKALVAKERIKGEKVILAKPQTFMNESGLAVQKLASYYNIDAADVLVIYDDLDLEQGELKIKPKGGHGGHNGLRSVINCLGESSFARVRIGIGRPEYRSVTDYVLGKFSSDERKNVEDTITKGSKAVELFLDGNLNKAMNKYN